MLILRFFLLQLLTFVLQMNSLIINDGIIHVEEIRWVTFMILLLIRKINEENDAILYI